MNKNFFKGKKKLLILIGIIMIVPIILYFSFSKEKDTSLITEENGIKYNNSKGITQDKKLNNLTFTDIKCSYDGEKSLLTYVIVNKTTKTIHLGEYEIIIKDKDNRILTNINPNLNYDIEPKEEYKISNEVNIDLTEAYYMELSSINHEEKE